MLGAVLTNPLPIRRPAARTGCTLALARALVALFSSLASRRMVCARGPRASRPTASSARRDSARPTAVATRLEGPASRRLAVVATPIACAATSAHAASVTERVRTAAASAAGRRSSVAVRPPAVSVALAPGRPLGPCAVRSTNTVDALCSSSSSLPTCSRKAARSFGAANTCSGPTLATRTSLSSTAAAAARPAPASEARRKKKTAAAPAAHAAAATSTPAAASRTLRGLLTRHRRGRGSRQNAKGRASRHRRAARHRAAVAAATSLRTGGGVSGAQHSRGRGGATAHVSVPCAHRAHTHASGITDRAPNRVSHQTSERRGGRSAAEATARSAARATAVQVSNAAVSPSHAGGSSTPTLEAASATTAWDVQR